MDKDNTKSEDIPEMSFDKKYSNKLPDIPETPGKIKKDMEKIKKELEKLKNFIVKKYPFTQAIGILPPMSIKLFIEEEEAPKETEKHVHMYVIVAEEKFKEIPKMKQEIVKQIEIMKQIGRASCRERV